MALTSAGTAVQEAGAISKLTLWKRPRLRDDRSRAYFAISTLREITIFGTSSPSHPETAGSDHVRLFASRPGKQAVRKRTNGGRAHHALHSETVPVCQRAERLFVEAEAVRPSENTVGCEHHQTAAALIEAGVERLSRECAVLERRRAHVRTNRDVSIGRCSATLLSSQQTPERLPFRAMSIGGADRARARREWILALAFALWGLAIAIAMSSVLQKPAPPGQPISVATLANVDARASMRWMFCLLLFPIAVPFLLRPVTRRLAAGQAWARNGAVSATLVTLWVTSVHQSVLWSLVPCAIAVITCTYLRNRDLQFTRRDVVLVPAFLAAWIALVDLSPVIPAYHHAVLAAAVVLAIRIGIAFIPSPLPPALAFLAVPLGLVLQTGFFARDQRYFGWHALAFVAVTPVLLRLFLRRERLALRLLVLVTFPVALYAYANALSATTAFGKPRVSYFEDGHNLVPASEYLRGELPYRDILPGHGLIEDGLFDYLVFRTGEVTAGRSLKARDVAGHLNTIALYALAFAATGSAEAGFLTVLLSIMTGTFTPTIRTLVPVTTLALTVAGVRTRHPRWFFRAAILAVLSGAMSLDYALYTCGALVVGMFLTGIRITFRPVALGLAAAAVPLFGTLAALGILDDFVRGTFVEIPAASTAYRLGFFRAPEAMRQNASFPEVLTVLLRPEVYQNLVWLAIAVGLGAALTRRWSRRVQPLLVLASWIALSGISFAYRFNHYFGMIAVVLVAAWTFGLARRRRPLAIFALVVLVVLARPTTHAFVVAMNRGARGTPPADWVEVRDIPRARGALWHVRDATAMRGVQKYLSLTLQPHETYFNFSDTAILHFVMRRDWPIREYEMAYLQSEEKQREVIRILETNHDIRATLMREGDFSIDFIPNAQRAPLLHQFLLEHFEPDFEEGHVTFWRRK